MSTEGAELTPQKPAPGFVVGSVDVVEEATLARDAHATLDFTERRWLLLVGDALFALIGGAVAVMVWNTTSGHGTATFSASRSLWGPLLAATWLLVAALFGTYSMNDFYVNVRSRVLLGLTSGAHLLCYLALYFVMPPSALPRVVFVAFSVAATTLVFAWRRTWYQTTRSDRFRRPLLVTLGDTGRELANALAERPEAGLEVIGFVSDTANGGRVHTSRNGGLPVLASTGEMAEVARRFGVAEVALDGSTRSPEALLAATLECHEQGITITRARDLLEAVTGRVHISSIADDWSTALPLSHAGSRILYRAIKRATDVGGGVIGVVVLALAFVPVAVAIKLDSRGPVFYHQTRTGRGGRPFIILKFRTMRTDAESGTGAIWAKPHDERATRIGAWLRRLHIDELPQFWNVLKGDMSLVGPRPERPEIDSELERTIPFYRMRWSVKPGLAGWAVVNGSYVDGSVKALERVEYDLYYIRHQSMWLDTKILLRAIADALRSRGQ